jgi:CRISPR-associated protein (TIGR03986 family)
MSLNDKLVEEAAGILRRKGVRDTRDIPGAVDLLAGYESFEAMENDELEAYARAALGKVGAAPGVGPGAGARPGSRPATGAKGGARPFDIARGGTPRELAPYTSPFVFVTLPDQVVPADQARLDILRADGYCATIRYTLEAETPLLVGAEASRSGPDEGIVVPMTMGGTDAYVIPGATLRGLVRAAVEIVAHGRLGSANLHHRFGIRDFEHPYYELVAKVERVKAGWLTGSTDPDGKVTMQIVPCDWAHVLIDDMAAAPAFAGRVSRREDWIVKSLTDKYQALGLAPGGGKPILYDFHETFGYGPPFDDKGRTVRKPMKGGTPGVPVMSGKLPGRGGKKKYEYAFFDRRGARPVPIGDAIVDDFVRMNSKPSKNRPVPDGSWKELKPTFDADRRIPVFYVGDLEAQGPDFFFGLTRMMKLPHRRSVGGVLAASHARHQPAYGQQNDLTYHADFVEGLFGYVVEPKDIGADQSASSAPPSIARKGRIAFSFATPKPGFGRARLSDPVVVIQSAPRASFAPFYLQPAQPGANDGEADYSAEQPPRLAGRKRYRPRDGAADALGRLAKIKAMGERQIEAVRQSSSGRPVSEEVKSRLRFLLPRDAGKPLVFEGEIRLHNVTAAEIGAVLFALTHGGDPAKPYRHMIGRAKPFGAGQMRLRTLDLAAEANDGRAIPPPAGEELASPDTRTGFCTDKGTASLKEFLDAFAAHMSKQPGLDKFPVVPAVLEFLGASEPAVDVSDAQLDYMGLKAFNELRGTVKPLKAPRGQTPQPPARATADDGRLLPAPKQPRKPPVFWT